MLFRSIEVLGGSTLTIDPSTIDNDGTIAVVDDNSILVLDTDEVTNTNGTIRVDAVDNLANTAPTLNLQGNSAITGTTIDDGTIINHGILEATSGINIIKNVATGSNPSDAGEQFINDGTIAVKFTATLTLDTDVLDNAGGTINVHSNATLNLNAVTIRGGTFTGAGDIYVLGTETTLDGSGSHPITIDDGTAITLRTGSTLTLDGTGGGSINRLGMIAIDKIGRAHV